MSLEKRIRGLAEQEPVLLLDSEIGKLVIA